MDDDVDAPPGASIISGECLGNVFKHLPPATLASCMCVNKHWRDFLKHDDAIWQLQCQNIYGITLGATPVGLDQQPLPSYRAACAQWHPFCKQYGNFALRAIHAWQQIHSWLDLHAPEILASLRPGATEAELDEAERTLKVRFPAALRVLYRIHDGQDLEFDRRIDNLRPIIGPSVFHGLFGGYQFYSHLVSTRMLPLRRMIRWTLHFRERLNLPDTDPDVMFAAGFNFNKVIHCVTNTGDVMVSHVPALTRNVQPTNVGEDEQSPPAPLPAYASLAATRAKELDYPVLSTAPDATLQWFEFYSEALFSNRFAMEILYDEIPDSRGICLFPRHPPLGPFAITRGIQVTASPLFIPELSNLRDVDDGDMQYFFAYSIRFRLLSVAEQKAAAAAAAAAAVASMSEATAPSLSASATEEEPFESVQLLDRAWVIRNAAGAVESEIHGEAVVGQYPLLIQGGDAFTYQSCTHQREPQGSMEGEFTFIEGSIEHPGPRQVKAQCPTFQLVMPDVVF